MNLSQRTYRFRWAHLLVLMLAVFADRVEAESEETQPLVVMTTREDGPYQGVVTGLRQTLESRREVTPLEVHSLKTGGESAIRLLRDMRSAGDRPILTIGSSATRVALEAQGTAPVIACMVVDNDELEAAKDATGVVLEFPLETQLEWIKRFVPKSNAIGVLYNPEENSERVSAARKVAKRLGLRLIAREVSRPQDLPDALDRLAREADILLGVTDKTVLSRQTAQAILLFSFRNRMPFSGLSRSWVKAGALYALERDYEDIGAQCAEMALEVLAGKKPSAIPPERPRKVVYVVNLKTADHLKLSLSPDVVEGAAEVFR